MKFTLGHRLCILVQGHSVRFCHRHRAVTLSRRQYRNLHDVIRHPQYYKLRSIPLGQGIWLQQKPFVKIDTIIFTYAQWLRYKREVHPQIMSFLHHARSRTHDQYHARNVGRRAHTPSRRPRSICAKQTLSPSPTHVGGENQQWTQGTTLPLRQTTSVGKPFSFRRALHDLRSGRSVTETQPELYSEPLEVDQFSSCCTIESPSSPSTY